MQIQSTSMVPAVDADLVEAAVVPTNVSLRASGLTVGIPLAVVASVAISTRSGLGLGVTAAAALVAMATAAGVQSSSARWCLATLPFAPWLVIRDNTWLGISILCTIALVLALAAIAAGTKQQLTDLSLGASRRRTPATEHVALPPVGLELIWAVLRGFAFALPVVAVFWAILASADRVFASVANPAMVPLGRIALFVVFIPAFVTVAKFSRNGRSARPKESAGLPDRFGVVESSIVLGAVSTLFAAFIALRLATLDRPLDAEAWRSDVRSGFFQLLWVVALTVLLVLAVRQAAGSSGLTGRVRHLGWLTIALAAGIDALALLRITEYVNVTFLSPLRFWSFGFGVWLFVVLGMAAVRLGSVGATYRWFTAAALASWMLFLLSFAVINPDQRIAQYNFDNYDPRPDASEIEPDWIAVKLLTWLSEDATVVIADNLDVLRPMPNTRYERMLDHLCTRDLDESWREWNLSRSAARDAIRDRC